jgi:three-Cys-motif partner protein
MNLPEQLYEGREQTYIKHAFLRRYLETLAVKVLMGGYTTFNYVDGFAGPWKIRDEKGCTDASFGVAVELLEQVRKFVAQRQPGRQLQVKFFLCEKDPAAADRLRAFAAQHPAIEIHVFEGAFEDNLEAIAQRIPDGFTFTFIDPTNWMVRIAEVCRFLKDRTGEFLFNFMTEEVSRHSVNPKVAHQFGDFVGDPDWQETVKQLPEGMKGELRVLHLLKDAFRQRGAANYLPDFSILKPLINREKMRLMLGTNDARGVKLFRDIHAKAEKEEFEKRRQARATVTSQDMLFSGADFADYEQGERGVGCKRYMAVAETVVVEALSDRKCIDFADLALEVMERLPMRETHVKELCVDMKNRQLVDYDLPAKAWKPKAGTMIYLAESM